MILNKTTLPNQTKFKTSIHDMKQQNGIQLCQFYYKSRTICNMQSARFKINFHQVYIPNTLQWSMLEEKICIN